HPADFLQEILEFEVPQVDAVQQYASAGWVVEPREQLHNRGLALAVFAYQRDALGRPQAKAHIAQNLTRLAGVVEGDVLEFEAQSNRSRRLQGIGLRENAWLEIEEIE